MSMTSGGIGRFARKKQLSKQDTPASFSTANDSSLGFSLNQCSGGNRPSSDINDETEFDTATTLANMKIAPRNDNSSADGSYDRPETPFNSFENVGNAPPSTPGGGFSTIDQMFEAMDNDVIGDEDERFGVMEGMLVDVTPAANDRCNGGSDFDQDGFASDDTVQGFNNFKTIPEKSEKLLRLDDPRVGNDDQKVNKTNESKRKFSTQSLTEPAQHGGGIVLFAKSKKCENAPVLAGDLNDHDHSVQQVDDGTTSLREFPVSIGNITRFETDLVSNKDEGINNANDSAVIASCSGRDGEGVEDSVNDNVTMIGTTLTEGGELITQRDSEMIADGVENDRLAAPKRSPYFPNDQSIFHSNRPGCGQDVSETAERISAGDDVAPRVSLSPPSLCLDNSRSDFENMNAVALFSPQGLNKDAYVDDDNSIVIPGVPASIASINVKGIGETSGRIGSGVGFYPDIESDFTKEISELRSTLHGLTGSTPWSGSDKNTTTQPTFVQDQSRSSSTLNSLTEKFVYRKEQARLSRTASTESNSVSSFKKCKLAAPLANPKSMLDSAQTLSTITPEHRLAGARDPESLNISHLTNANIGGAITPTPRKLTAMEPRSRDSVPTQSTNIELTPMTMEEAQTQVEHQFSDIPQRGRPRSQSIYSPTPSTTADSVTPKACNMNQSATNECFDKLLSEFFTNIQEGADINEKGQNDLLELEVEVSHAFAAVLGYKDDYTSLLNEIEGIQSMAETILSEVSK